MFTVLIEYNSLPVIQSKWTHAERTLQLPFAPTAGLFLQFGTGNGIYEMVLSKVVWDTVNRVFYAEAEDFDAVTDDHFPVRWGFYEDIVFGGKDAQQCPHESVDCACIILYDVDELLQLLSSDGWSVEITDR